MANSALQGLIERATVADGVPPFSDGSLVALAQGERELLWLEDAAAIVSPTEAEFVVDPPARRRGLGRELLHRLLDAAAGDLLLWSHGDHPAARALARTFGLAPVRTLLQLRLTVPGPTPAGSAESRSDLAAVPVGKEGALAPVSKGPAALRVGPFETAAVVPEEGALAPVSKGGLLRDRWVELNARAFAAHPEQGSVTRDDLDLLIQEPWFDPDDFLLLWDSDDLVGYCWLKVEHGIGEFYVVGVSPDRQGQGLGRVLVAQGLDRLRERGIPTAALYVEGDNAPALRLYRSFGFREHSVDIQYRWRSEPDD